MLGGSSMKMESKFWSSRWARRLKRFLATSLRLPSSLSQKISVDGAWGAWCGRWRKMMAYLPKGLRSWGSFSEEKGFKGVWGL